MAEVYDEAMGNTERFAERRDHMEGSGMNELELKEQAIKEFVDLQRLKVAKDKEKEIAYQEKILRARLQALGIPTEDLELKAE